MGLFAEALRQRSRDPEVAGLVNSINESVDALEGLFGELLDITRIDTGGVEVNPAPVRMRELFAGCACTSSRRWSKAPSAALAPSPTAMTICLNGTVVTSPAANTPGSRRLAARVDDDLADARQLERALQPLGVGHQADLHEHAFQIERVCSRR
jgi:signal transduction histidine kinase